MFLSIITYQDFKQRAIRWELLPLLLLCVLTQGYIQIGGSRLLYFGGLNLLFFVAQMILLTLYLSIKFKRWINITKKHLGLGDILFFIPMSFMFTPLNLIIFFIVALLITIIGTLAIQVLFKPTYKTIPLAGILSLYLIIILILESSTILSRWNDWLHG